MPPEFLVVGHVVQDLLSDDGSWRLGGAASYASTLARNLGLRTAVLTAASPDVPLAKLLPGIDCHVAPSGSTTQIRNIYAPGSKRQQFVPRCAARLTADHLPDEWRDSRIVLLGPVAGEIDDALAASFPRSLVGAGAQGWLREIGPDSRVRPVHPADWQAGAILRAARALFLSDEDVPPEDAPAALAEWSGMIDIVVFTRGYDGADVCHGGEWRRIAAFPASPIDLTGAGDIFATAFLIRLSETNDVSEAARFASCAASFVIEAEGILGVPRREQIETRLRAHPEIVCQ
jgi:sugar/nucleoside kinase (ribokinase family)